MSEETNSTWTRSKSVPFPSVWSRFERKDPKNSTVIRKFRIQDVSDDIVAPLLHLMETSFILEEPLLKAINLANDPVSVEEFKILYKEIIAQKLSLVCLEEDPDGNIIEQGGVPVVAGFNVLFVTAKGDSEEIPKIEGTAMKRLFELYPFIMQGMDMLKMYNVDAYISGGGLSVAPNFRGLGIGLAILNARDELARAVEIEIMSTVFSSEISQALAVRAGYEELCEKFYEDVEKQYPDVSFAGIATKSGKYMMKRIQR